MKTKSNASITQPTYQQISDRARQLWEKNGSPEGRDVEFWLDAENQLRGPSSAASSVTAAPFGSKRSLNSTKTRDGDTIRQKTDDMLDDIGEPGNRSPTALNLDRS